MFPSLIYVLHVLHAPVPTQSSYYWVTYKNSTQGASKLDVVTWHSRTKLTWRYME